LGRDTSWVVAEAASSLLRGKYKMEIVIMLFVLVGGSIAFSAWRKSRSSENAQVVVQEDEPNKGCSVRKCLVCQYEGEMKTWISHFIAPKLYVFLGLLLGYVPGLIFIVFYWGKYKCPSCGSVGKNQMIQEECSTDEKG
jgi:hypothetical protein